MMTRATAQGLCTFIDASPTPFHVVATVASELDQSGFSPVSEASPWPAIPGRYYAVRGGSIVAWSTETAAPELSFRVVGGHTDSPNLRVKQHADYAYANLAMVALEPYGGAWLNSWLDRDLGVAGRLSYREDNRVATTMVLIDEPVLRVPQLAIHLSEDRCGVAPDRQRHVNAIWGEVSGQSFVDYVASTVGVAANDVLGFELMTFDLTPSTLVGADREFVSAPRLDNQGTCYSGLSAFLDVVSAEHTGPVPVLALFDHEEVGSTSDRGAASDLLVTVLERIVLADGGSREQFLQTMARSVCCSGDMAHATHPNYVDRHEPLHRIELGGGPVLKVNQNLRYASDAAGEAVFALACAQADVPLQRYVHRADLPCGSTIGPITASRTGLCTVDVGAAQLAMHSAREMMSAVDVELYASALAAFFDPES